MKSNLLTPERISSFIRNFLPKHFEIASGIYPGNEMSLARVVMDSIGCASDDVCNAIAKYLEIPTDDDQNFYFPGQAYFCASSTFDDEDHERWYVTGEWKSIASELVHGRRFFNSSAQKFFESLVNEALGARRSEGAGESAVLTTLPKGSYFYRARLACNMHEAQEFVKEPESKLGAPPKEKAGNNRMSVSGVPLFYAANDVETCIAEIRPSIGDLVVVARFECTKQLKFFDFNALSYQLEHKRLSLFDVDYGRRVYHRKLLNYLHDEIAQPVRKTDVDYVMTQALAEFIRFNKLCSFDGISFRSVQNRGGVNYVIFENRDVSNLVNLDGEPVFDVTAKSAEVEIHEVEGVKFSLRKKLK